MRPARVPGDLQRVMGDAQMVRERLLRSAVALSATNAALAERFDHMAAAGGPMASSYRLEAKRARSAADECREFAARLNHLYGGDGDA